ncbi:hypothetical protein QEN19_003649 [Hanseniaspora menglaensis]
MSTTVDVSLWQPDARILQDISTVLMQSMDYTNNNIRLDAMQKIESFGQSDTESFLNYLLFIFLDTNSNSTVSSTAGLLLKNSLLNNILHNSSFSSYVPSEFIKLNLLVGLQIPTFSPLNKNITGIIITTLFSTYFTKQGRTNNDPLGLVIIQNLIQLVDEHQNLPAMRALTKILEDSANYFDLQWNNGTVFPLNLIVPKLIEYLSNESVDIKIKSEALKCLNCIIPLQTQSLLIHLDELLNQLFSLAMTKEDSLLREQLCICFSTILEFRPDKLATHLSGLVQFMCHLIESHKNKDEFAENAALEASDFLLALSTSSNIPTNLIEPYLGQMVPVLVSNLVYDQEKIDLVEALNDENDSLIPDKDENIKPTVGVTNITKKKKNNDGDEDQDADDDEDDDYFWTLRKSCANTLDCLTELFPAQITSLAFPLIKDHLANQVWYIREASILALGVLSEGVIKHVADFEKIIPLLIQELEDPVSSCREITCWTLRRYSEWLSVKHPHLIFKILQPMLTSTLFDIKKSVQASAISALGDFIQASDQSIFDTLLADEIIVVLHRCLDVYQKKNLLFLYDTIQVYLEKKQELDETELNIIMPSIMARWDSLTDSDKELWPLLQCLSTMAVVLGPGFVTMAPRVYERACKIIVDCIQSEIAYNNTPNSASKPLEKDFLVGCLDLIDGLVQGMGDKIEHLLFSSQLNICTILAQCLKDPVHEVRQSSFALIGDLIIGNYHQMCKQTEFLEPFLKSLLLELQQTNESLDSDAAVNSLSNALWCLGVFVDNLDVPQEQLLSSITYALDLLNQNVVSDLVNVNIIVLLGKLSMKVPELLATVPQFSNNSLNIVDKWCHYSKDMEDPDEKTASILGFCKFINTSGYSISLNQLSDMIEGIMNGDVYTESLMQDLYSVIMSHQTLVPQMRQELVSYINSL